MQNQDANTGRVENKRKTNKHVTHKSERGKEGCVAETETERPEESKRGQTRHHLNKSINTRHKSARDGEREMTG